MCGVYIPHQSNKTKCQQTSELTVIRFSKYMYNVCKLVYNDKNKCSCICICIQLKMSKPDIKWTCVMKQTISDTHT